MYHGKACSAVPVPSVLCHAGIIDDTVPLLMIYMGAAHERPRVTLFHAERGEQRGEGHQRRPSTQFDGHVMFYSSDLLNKRAL